MRAHGLLQDPLEHRGDADEEGDGAPAVRIEGQSGIEFGQDHLGGGEANGRAQEEGESEGVEVGQEAVKGLGALVEHPHPEHALVHIRADIAVGQGSGLRYAVRTRCVEDYGAVGAHGMRIKLVNRGRAGHGPIPRAGGIGNIGSQLIAGLLRALDRQGEKRPLGDGHVRRQIDSENSAEPGGGIEGVSIGALLPDDGDPAAMAHELVVDLRGGGERIMLGGHRADSHAGIEGDQCLRTIRQGDRHDITRTHSGVDEDPRCFENLTVDLRVGERIAEEVEGVPIGIEPGGIIEQCEEGALPHGDLPWGGVVLLVGLLGDARHVPSRSYADDAPGTAPRQVIPSAPTTYRKFQ